MSSYSQVQAAVSAAIARICQDLDGLLISKPLQQDRTPTPTGTRSGARPAYAQHWIAKPTIAAVDGFALGGGTELVLASALLVLDRRLHLGF